MGSVGMPSAPRILRAGDDLSGFSCGEPAIDAWVSSRASGARKAGAAVVYAAFDGTTAAGFYTLSASSIERASVAGGWLRRNVPERIPVILLGMLGVGSRYQGKGIGRSLVIDALRRSETVSGVIGARALVVEPLRPELAAFYLERGFEALPGVPRALFARL